ncbi:MAG: hypothetical protein SWJ54_22230, partial [Cyanobacteriota bacterium]|nr:hypothetical protein [Cyanobacteriota bacterium]
METLQTLEVRWFESGYIPQIVEEWFLKTCIGKLSSLQKERNDQYFYTPGCEVLNLKLRQGKLELKWRQTELGAYSFGTKSWKGKVERWLKWSYQESIPIKLMQTLGTGDQPIVTVNKKRSKRQYQGVDIELAQIRLEEHKYWWTLGFEMEETRMHKVAHFEQVISQVLSNYPQRA